MNSCQVAGSLASQELATCHYGHAGEQHVQDPEKIILACESPQHLLKATNTVTSQLPHDLGRRFSSAFMSNLSQHGIQGAFDRMNNRSVSEILADFTGQDDRKPLVSGETDGVRYQLFDPPDKPDT